MRISKFSHCLVSLKKQNKTDSFCNSRVVVDNDNTQAFVRQCCDGRAFSLLEPKKEVWDRAERSSTGIS